MNAMDSDSPAPARAAAPASSGWIDCHVHRYPDEVIADPAAWAQQRHETHWCELVLTGPQDWADRRKILADMDAAGVQQCVLLGWYWENHDTCREQNDWHARWIREDPQRFVAFAALNPAAGELAIAELERCARAGFRGVGELMHTVQGFGLATHAMDAVARWAAEHGWPVNLHVTEPAGHHYPGRVDTPLQSIADFAARHPDLKLILAHWGGGLPFYTLNRTVRRALRNVWFDTAAGPLLFDDRVFRSVCDLVGADRVLFGSDYPLKLYPRSTAPADMRRYLSAARSAGLSEAEWHAIARDNARALLGMD